MTSKNFQQVHVTNVVESVTQVILKVHHSLRIGINDNDPNYEVYIVLSLNEINNLSRM